MSQDYPLTRALGVEVVYDAELYIEPCPRERLMHAHVLAADLECVLESAPVVYQYKSLSNLGDWSHEIDEDFGGKKKYMNTARLLCIQPIVKDTAEGLLREMLKTLAWSAFGSTEIISINDEQKMLELRNRARALLEGK